MFIAMVTKQDQFRLDLVSQDRLHIYLFRGIFL